MLNTFKKIIFIGMIIGFSCSPRICITEELKEKLIRYDYTPTNETKTKCLKVYEKLLLFNGLKEITGVAQDSSSLFIQSIINSSFERTPIEHCDFLLVKSNVEAKALEYFGAKVFSIRNKNIKGALDIIRKGRANYKIYELNINKVLKPTTICGKNSVYECRIKIEVKENSPCMKNYYWKKVYQCELNENGEAIAARRLYQKMNICAF